MRATRTILAAAGVVLAGTSAFGQNLLTNGSFEGPAQGFLLAAGWAGFNNASIEQPILDDGSGNLFEFPQDGTQSVKMFGQFAPDGGQTEAGVFQVDVVLEPETEYSLTVYTLTQSVDPITEFIPSDGMTPNFGHLPLMIVDMKDSGGGALASAEAMAFDFDNDLPDTWNQQELIFTTPPGTASAQVTFLFLQFDIPPGSLFWDNAVLAETGNTCPPTADFNEDGTVDVIDVLDLLDDIDECQNGGM